MSCGIHHYCCDLQAISSREVEDLVALEEKLGRALSKQERSRIGVNSLRLFLEELLLKRYIFFSPFFVCLKSFI